MRFAQPVERLAVLYGGFEFAETLAAFALDELCRLRRRRFALSFEAGDFVIQHLVDRGVADTKLRCNLDALHA